MTMLSNLPPALRSRWGLRRLVFSGLSPLDRMRLNWAMLEMFESLESLLRQIAEADISELAKLGVKGVQARCKRALLSFDRVFGSCLGGNDQGPLRRRHLLLDIAVR